MDRLQALKVFVAVAEAESFAAGARSVDLSAPSATRGVNALEAALGAKLFARTTRRVRLTEVGRSYLNEVREILGLLHAADEAVSGAARTPVGQLRITCPQEFGRIYVAPVLTAFVDRYAGVTADVLMVDRIVNIVEEGFDIAIRIGPLPSSGLTAVRVGQVRRVVCGAPGYLAERGRPLDPTDLADHRIVSTGTASSPKEWRFGQDKRQTVRIDPHLTVSSIAAAIEIAKSGWGICRVLSYQIGPDLEAGILQTVLDDYEPAALPIHLVHVEGRKAPAKVRTFIDFAGNRLRRIPVLQQRVTSNT